MLTPAAVKFLLAACLACALTLTPRAGSARAQGQQGTPGDSVISNRAEATYLDGDGTGYSAVSATVTVTVRPVSSVVVTPDETEPSQAVAAGERVTRRFAVCNYGNTPDLYTITRAEVAAPAAIAGLYFDSDDSGTVTAADAPVSVNASLSPRLNPRACVAVLAVVDTNAAPPQTRLAIRLTARSNVASTVNGPVQDDGTIINAVGERARLTDPGDASLPPLKLVNDRRRVVTAPGQTLDYAISFRNRGQVAARRVLVADELPAGLDYVPGSLRLGARPLTDADDADEGRAASGNRRLEVRLAEMRLDEIVTFTFRARVTDQLAPGAGAVNTAAVSGENIEAVNSSTATAVVNPFGTVYNGRTGGAVTVAGARVALLTDPSAGTPLQTAPGLGYAPNAQNDNPYTTGAGGLFGFALAPDQLGAPGAPARYFIHVSARGYRARMIEFSVRPAALGLYTATVRALDDQPLARAGGFALAESDVTLEGLASVALNIPVFETQTLELTKHADQPRAEIGDVVSYRLELRNTTQAALHDLTVLDQLPQSFHYAQGTAQLSLPPAGPRQIEPEAAGNQLTFRLGTLPPGGHASLTYRVRVGANARPGDQTNSAAAAGVFASGERVTTPQARAVVRVSAGVFSTRQIVVGRVFEDADDDGEFDEGEPAIGGARLYLANGQSATTDAQGMYNLPAVEDGAVVIALDAVTLPRGYALADDGRREGRSWTRLLRTPLGGGTLLRQNFALRRVGSVDVEAGAAPPAPPTAAGYNAPAAKVSEGAHGGTGNFNGATPRHERSHAPLTQTAAASLARSNDGAHVEKIAGVKPPAAGTYEETAGELIAPVAPGEVVVVSPAPDEVVMTPALEVVVRVAEGWQAGLEVNGERVKDSSVSLRRVDHKHKVAAFTFVGLSLKPGANRVRAFALSAAGEAGNAVELEVRGRGPARRLEIESERGELRAGGRDSALLRVRAFDQWGQPAADGQVAITTTSGSLLRSDDDILGMTGGAGQAPAGAAAEHDRLATGQAGAERARQQQLVLSLRGGEAVVRLASDNAPGAAEVRAKLGEIEAAKTLRFTAELRPAILVGLAEASVGRAAPDNALRSTDARARGHVEFFYRGRLFGENLLTLAYDSQRPLNRAQGRDRLFQPDPLDRPYPLFGDSSARFDAIESNSKLYARLDRGRSYVMFGDFEADMQDSSLAGYARKLTGVKLHLENSAGDFVTVTGARPDTAFARDVFPAGRLGLLRLSHPDVLQGSETVVLEVRDRRNPERLVSREPFVRSLDYNLDPLTGQIFFLRPVSAFDYDLNLVQLVVTYEHRGAGQSAGVYTGRAAKRFDRLGLRLGLSFVDQEQGEFGAYRLAGFDGEQELWRRGRLRFEWATSRGELAAAGNLFGGAERHAGGNAYRLDLNQPFKFYDGVLKAEYARADEGFFNPFGATVAPGSSRAGASVDLKPRASRALRLAYQRERNRTANVDNARDALSFLWTETFSDKLHAFAGYDYRHLADERGGQQINSHLLTVGAQYRPTDKLELSVKREQNLGEADPTYPDQTTVAARYRWNEWANVFFTQRLASAPIIPIGDVAATGFAATGSRRETAVGVETRLGRHTSLTSRYQLDNGINGADSFAVIGLQHRLPVSTKLSLDLGFERGFHLAGAGESFTGGAFGLSWLPAKDLRTAVRYELRDQAGGTGQLLTLGAAGRVSEGVTTLARLQWSRAGFDGRENASLMGTAALAFRPARSDRAALLFSYTHRSLTQGEAGGRAPYTERADLLSTDGLWQAAKDTELYGRFALKFGRNGREGLLPTSALTYIAQLRAQKRLRRSFDVAGEWRILAQPVTQTRRNSLGAEIGYWIIPDVRIGFGYSFASAAEPEGSLVVEQPRGFYFTVSTKLSNLFDLFGTSGEGLAPAGDEQNAGADKANKQEGQEKAGATKKDAGTRTVPASSTSRPAAGGNR